MLCSHHKALQAQLIVVVSIVKVVSIVNLNGEFWLGHLL